MQAAKMAGFYTFLTVALMGTLVALSPMEKEQVEDKKSILETKIGEFLKAHSTRKEQQQTVDVAKETGSAASSENTHKKFMESLLSSGPDRQRQIHQDHQRNKQKQQQQLSQENIRNKDSKEQLTEKLRLLLEKAEKLKTRSQASSDGDVKEASDKHEQAKTAKTLSELFKRLGLNRAANHVPGRKASMAGSYRKRFRERLSNGLNQEQLEKPGQQRIMQGLNNDRRSHARKSPLRNTVNQRAQNSKTRSASGLRKRYLTHDYCYSVVYGAPYNNWNTWSSYNDYGSGYNDWNTWSSYNDYGSGYGSGNNWNTWSSYNDYGSGYNDWNTWSSYNDYGSGNNWNAWSSYNDYGSGYNDWNTWSSYNDYGSGYGSGNNWNTWSSYNDYGSGYNDWNTWSSYNDYGSGYNDWNTWSSYNDYGSGYGSGNNWNAWSTYNDYGSGYNDWNTWSSYNDYGSGYGSGNNWNTWSSYNDYGSGYDNWNSWSSHYPYYDYSSGNDDWNSWPSYYDYGSGYPYNYDTSDYDMCIAMYFSGGAYSPSFNYSCEVPCSDKFGDEFVQCVYVKGSELEDELQTLYNRPGSDEIVPADLKEGVHQLMASNGYPPEIALDIYKLYIQLLFQRVHEPTYSEEPSDLKCKFYNLMQVASDTMGLHNRRNAAHKRAQGVVITAPDDKGAKVQRPYTQAKTIE